MKNKYCGKCGKNMQRWGKTAAGTSRYRCFVCKRSSIIHRSDTKSRHNKDRLISWLTGVQNLSSKTKSLHITRQGLWKEFRPFFRQNPNGMAPMGFKANLLIVDAKFIHGNELCALIAVTEKDKIFWQFADSECYGTWYSCLV